MTIIVVGHATVIDRSIYESPVNTITETLDAKGDPYIFIRHFIKGEFQSVAYINDGLSLAAEFKLNVIKKPDFIRYLNEVFATCWFLYKFKPKVPTVYIGVDPLNAISGILLRILGKTDKVVYFCVDYSIKRFKNKILNALYHAIDRYVSQRADLVWSVSSRIQEEKKKLGVHDARNLLLPNVPSSKHELYKLNKRNKYRLITLGIVSDQLDFMGIIEAVKLLRHTYPSLELHVYGDGPKRIFYENYAFENGLSTCVFFHGSVTHDQALSAISQSGIGLALYNGNWGFNYYGDSMKCREYFAYGLPVITTDTHSTVIDIRESGAGIVADINSKSYVDAINKIYNRYENYSAASAELALKFNNIHHKYISELLSQ